MIASRRSDTLVGLELRSITGSSSLRKTFLMALGLMGWEERCSTPISGARRPSTATSPDDGSHPGNSPTHEHKFAGCPFVNPCLCPCLCSLPMPEPLPDPLLLALPALLASPCAFLLSIRLRQIPLCCCHAISPKFPLFPMPPPSPPLMLTPPCPMLSSDPLHCNEKSANEKSCVGVMGERHVVASEPELWLSHVNA